MIKRILRMLGKIYPEDIKPLIYIPSKDVMKWAFGNGYGKMTPGLESRKKWKELHPDLPEIQGNWPAEEILKWIEKLYSMRKHKS